MSTGIDDKSIFVIVVLEHFSTMSKPEHLSLCFILEVFFFLIDTISPPYVCVISFDSNNAIFEALVDCLEFLRVLSYQSLAFSAFSKAVSSSTGIISIFTPSMKHIFIINPASGKENATEFVQQKVAEVQVEHEIYITKAPGDAIQYIKNHCTNDTQPVRFYACGGDGTLNEVVNGATEFDFASVGCIPCGSGNDFIKYYGGKEPFLDLKAQVNGTDTPIDLIRVKDKYAINAVHFGFDSCVANLITKLRRVPVIGGKHVYPFSVFIGLIIGMYHRCKVEVDGECLNPKGSILLCTIANGQYVGGSYRCAPRSRNDDALLEVCLFKPLSHIRFAQMMKSYQAGTHLDEPAYRPYFEYKQGKSVHITAPSGFIFSMDGEIVHDNDFVVEIMPRQLKFIVPEGAEPIGCVGSEV